MKIQNLIGLFFLARDITHTAHLNTRSYAKHMALGGFYEGIIPLTDALVEAYQGRHGLIGQIPLQTVKTSGEITKVLESQLKQIESCREEALGPDSALQNALDEIITLYLTTIYKLKFLA